MLNFIVLGYIPGTSIQITFMYIVVLLDTLFLLGSVFWFFTDYHFRRSTMDLIIIKMVAHRLKRLRRA